MSAAPLPSAQDSAIAASRWRLSIIVAVGLLVLRLPSMLHGYDIDDEGLHSLVSSIWMEGGRPYVDVIERKPPLQYGLYALIFGIAGRFNMSAVHVVAALWTLGTMAALAVVGRRLFGRRAGIAAAILYGIYSGFGPYQNLALNGELCLNLPVAWALVLTFSRGRTSYRPSLFGAGVLMGAAFLFKQPAAVLAPALGIYLLLPSYRRSRGLGISHSLLHAGVFTLGFAAPVLAAVAYLRRQGVLDDALFWCFRHHDMPHGPGDIIFWERFIVACVWFGLACFPLLMAARAALAVPTRFGDWRGREAERSALILLLGFGMIGVSGSGRFYLHYFLLLMPALALAAAPAVAALWAGTAPDGPWPLRRRALPRVLAVTAVTFFVVHTISLARRHTGNEAARFVREHSTAQDRLFVWGEQPRVYVEAGRRPSTRYIGTYPLTGYPYGGVISYEPAYSDTSARIVPGAWAIAMRELDQNQPRFIVDVEARSKTPRYPMAKYPALARLLETRYRLVQDLPDGVVYQRTSESGDQVHQR